MNKSRCGSDPHKKNCKQCIKNYRPVSLLPIYSKIFERLLFKEFCKIFHENDLLSSNQSGFKLLSITHEISRSFDNDLEVRGVFLDLSKVFDKVSHEGLILKLSRNDILRNLLNLLRDCLKYRKEHLKMERNHFM